MKSLWFWFVFRNWLNFGLIWFDEICNFVFSLIYIQNRQHTRVIKSFRDEWGIILLTWNKLNLDESPAFFLSQSISRRQIICPIFVFNGQRWFDLVNLWESLHKLFGNLLDGAESLADNKSLALVANLYSNVLHAQNFSICLINNYKRAIIFICIELMHDIDFWSKKN